MLLRNSFLLFRSSRRLLLVLGNLDSLVHHRFESLEAAVGWWMSTAHGEERSLSFKPIVLST